MANFLAQFQTIKNTSDRLVISGISSLSSSHRFVTEDPISSVPSAFARGFQALCYSQSHQNAPFLSVFIFKGALYQF